VYHEASAEVFVSRWLAHRKPNSLAKYRLFCLPYAGGAASVYREWQDALPREIEVCAVELPGRGVRFNDRPFDKMDALVPALVEGLLPLLDKPFALFGHSMGAVIAFELTRLLRERGRAPVHLFPSAHRAPHLPDDRDAIHGLAHREFLARVQELGGMPSSVLENEELLEIVVPILRVDFQLIETYVHRPGEPLDCPVTAFGGLEDEHAERAQIAPWSEHTRGAFALRMLPGDHFFLQDSRATMVREIARALLAPTPSVSV
jgi:medium-chain acyl-[acyl-carrier-protein] hydrolase